MKALKNPEIRRKWEKDDIVEHYRKYPDRDRRMDIGKHLNSEKHTWKTK